jgi:hypothetical protein
MTTMKIDTRMVIVFAILYLLVVISGCVTQPETTAPQPKETPTQQISVAEEHTDTKFTLFVTITKPQPYLLETVLIQPDGDEAYGGIISYERGWVGSENRTLDGLFDGNNVVILRNMDNKSEIFYQTNWTVRLQRYKPNDDISRNGLDMTFKPYQITSVSVYDPVYDPNKKRIEIPVEGKNTISIKEKEAGVCALRLKVDRGYFYEPSTYGGYMTFRLEPGEKVERKFIFDIPKDLEPIEMHEYFSLNCAPAYIKDVFVLELKK